MTWWGWLIVSVFAWIAADAFFVLLVDWRRATKPRELYKAPERNSHPRREM